MNPTIVVFCMVLCSVFFFSGCENADMEKKATVETVTGDLASGPVVSSGKNAELTQKEVMENWSTFGWYGYAHQPDEIINLSGGERKEIFYWVDDVIEVVYDVESREQAKVKCKEDLKLLQENYEISEGTGGNYKYHTDPTLVSIRKYGCDNHVYGNATVFFTSMDRALDLSTDDFRMLVLRSKKLYKNMSDHILIDQCQPPVERYEEEYKYRGPYLDDNLDINTGIDYIHCMLYTPDEGIPEYHGSILTIRPLNKKYEEEYKYRGPYLDDNLDINTGIDYIHCMLYTPDEGIPEYHGSILTIRPLNKKYDIGFSTEEFCGALGESGGTNPYLSCKDNEKSICGVLSGNVCYEKIYNKSQSSHDEQDYIYQSYTMIEGNYKFSTEYRPIGERMISGPFIQAAE